MNVSKFITTVLGTAIYTSLLWLTLLGINGIFEIPPRVWPGIGLPFAFFTVFILFGSIKWLVDNWD